VQSHKRVVFWAAGCRTRAAVSNDMARVLVHATAALELILSTSIAGVVSTGPEDTADGFEAGQTHRLALIPANAVEPWASIAAAATSVARVSHGRLGWPGDLDDGWHAVGADRLDGDRVADAVMAALSQCGQARLIAVAEMQVAPRTARCFANCSPMPLAPPVTTARPRRNWYGSSLLITSRSARNESTDRSRWLLAGVL
jgi:hypothetical protein